MVKARRGWKRFTELEGVGEDLLKASRNVWLPGLGAASAASDKARALFGGFVEEGERLEESRRRAVERANEQLATRFAELRDKVVDGVQGAASTTLHRFGIPTHTDIQTLLERVELLTRRVHAMGAAD